MVIATEICLLHFLHQSRSFCETGLSLMKWKVICFLFLNLFVSSNNSGMLNTNDINIIFDILYFLNSWSKSFAICNCRINVNLANAIKLIMKVAALNCDALYKSY